MRVHNERNFPQAKLDSEIMDNRRDVSSTIHGEINVPFLLNENGDLCFLSHNNSVHIILLRFKHKIKELSDSKKM